MILMILIFFFLYIVLISKNMCKLLNNKDKVISQSLSQSYICIHNFFRLPSYIVFNNSYISNYMHNMEERILNRLN